jgi:hypothetical protein
MFDTSKAHHGQIPDISTDMALEPDLSHVSPHHLCAHSEEGAAGGGTGFETE